MEVVNNPAAGRFEITVDDKVAYEQYMISGDTITFIHSYTPVELRGKGLAGELAKYSLEYAKANKLKVIIKCPYITGYIEKHPEYKTLLQ